MKPNILLIVTDEHPTRRVSCYGSEEVHTPNLDRLAAEGVRFERAYTCSPTCTPARAGMMTGIYPQNTGAWANNLPLGQGVRTLGHHFRAAGYRTAYIGKWHLDGLDYFGTGVCPEEFEDEYWFDGKRYLDFLGPERIAQWRSHKLDSAATLKAHGVDRDWTWGGQITNRALAFLESGPNDDRPWLLIVSYDEPHGPWTCPPEFLARHEGKEYPLPETFGQFPRGPKAGQVSSPARTEGMAGPGEQACSAPPAWLLREIPEDYIRRVTRLTAACSEFVDDEIGRVMQAAGSVRDTVTVYTTDHGNQLGAHSLMFKGPYMYEESCRIPMLIGGPGIRAGHVEKAVVSNIDLPPTLLDLAGLEPPPVFDGASLHPLIAAERRAGTHPDRAIIAFNRFELDHDKNGGLYPMRAIVRGPHKLVVCLLGQDELYDLEKDPGETHNRIDDPGYAGIRDRLHAELVEWMYVHRDAFRTPLWETRPWSSARRFTDDPAHKMRTTPWNGLDGKAKGYDSGTEIVYDGKP